MPEEGLPRALGLGTLPVSTVAEPIATSVENKTLYEYPIFGAAYLADTTEWPPLELILWGRPVRILKPRIGQVNAHVQGVIASQNLDVRSTTFTFETALYAISETPPPDAYVQTLAALIHLLRTAARQYWLGLTMANEGAVYQAVRARIDAGTASFLGAGGFTTPFTIRPIDLKTWRFLGEMLEKGCSPSNSEVVICDALLEVRRGALLNAVLLWGVACEIEVTALIDQLSDQKGISRNERNTKSRLPFKTKFTTRCVDLGTSDPRSSKVLSFAPDWADTVCALYTARNKVAHAGICMIEDGGTTQPLQMHHLPRLLYAADALLCWANLERKRLGIPPYLTATMLPGGYPVRGAVIP
jgi:hypothetical protein